MVKHFAGAVEMPDAMEIIFQQALLVGTNAAVSRQTVFTFQFAHNLTFLSSSML